MQHGAAAVASRGAAAVFSRGAAAVFSHRVAAAFSVVTIFSRGAAVFSHKAAPVATGAGSSRVKSDPEGGRTTAISLQGTWKARITRSRPPITPPVSAPGTAPTSAAGRTHHPRRASNESTTRAPYAPTNTAHPVA